MQPKSYHWHECQPTWVKVLVYSCEITLSNWFASISAVNGRNIRLLCKNTHQEMTKETEFWDYSDIGIARTLWSPVSFQFHRYCFVWNFDHLNGPVILNLVRYGGKQSPLRQIPFLRRSLLWLTYMVAAVILLADISSHTWLAPDGQLLGVCFANCTYMQYLTVSGDSMLIYLSLLFLSSAISEYCTRLFKW